MPRLMLFLSFVFAALVFTQASAFPTLGRSWTRSSRGDLDPYPGKPKLTFRWDGTFKVASFSDMHYGEAEDADWGPQQDVNTTRVHNNVLDAETPDYVVFNGDLVTGENTFAANSTAYVHRCLAPTLQRSIPFSSTYGNHDNSPNLTHEEILDVEQGYALSYTRSAVGPRPYGLANYWVPIYKYWWSTKPRVVLWFFDSRSFVADLLGTDYNDWVDNVTVPHWIESTTQSMKAEWGAVPVSLAFVHIPVDAAHALYEIVSTTFNPDFVGNFADGDPNSEGDSPGGGLYTGQDKPFWDALTTHVGGSDGSNLLGVTSGHDHGESWCARSATERIPICFNGHSGYGGYGSWNRNARIFELDLKLLEKASPSVKTHNRYENGTIGEAVTLGPDFGGI